MSIRSYIRTRLIDCVWLVVLVVSLPWLAWRFLFKGKNRRGWSQKLFGLVPRIEKRNGMKRVWLHAVSVGEVHLLKTLIPSLLNEHDVEVFISTTTETGYDRAVSLFGDTHQVFFFPFDFSWAIHNAIRRIDADLLVLAELELWPNLIRLANESSLPVVVANGRLGEKSHRNYRRFSLLTGSMFRELDHVLAQDDISADRFVELGCDRVTVTGNLKYDAIETNRKNAKSDSCRVIARDFGIADSDQVFIAGSTQIEDELVAVDAWLRIKDDFPSLKLVIVPRHPKRIAEIESMLSYRGLAANCRSNHGQGSIESDILIIDVIGELSGWWGLADIAFVGGSMGSRGGQNMIEPAAYGIPVCFGPNTFNFASTVNGLKSVKAATVVHNSIELAEFTARMLFDSKEANDIGGRGQEFVLQHRGAAERTAELLQEYLVTHRYDSANRAA